MWDKFKTIFSFLIAVFSAIFTIVASIIFDQLEVEIRIIILLSIIILSLLITIIVFSIHDQKKYSSLLQLYSDRSKNHTALSNQYKKKLYMLNIYQRSWNFMMQHILLLKSGKITERADALQDLYIKLNDDISKEEQKQ